MRECKSPVPPLVTITTTDTITRIDSIKGETKIIAPKTDTVIKEFPYPVYIDTNKTIRDYFLTKKYDILMRDDSVAKLLLHASIRQNAIDSISLEQNIYHKTTTITKYIKEPLRNKVYVGVAPGYSIKDSSVLVSGVVALNTKKDHLYFIKAEPFKQQYEFGLLWKIKIKQK